MTFKRDGQERTAAITLDSGEEALFSPEQLAAAGQGAKPASISPTRSTNCWTKSGSG